MVLVSDRKCGTKEQHWDVILGFILETDSVVGRVMVSHCGHHRQASSLSPEEAN